MYMTVKSKIRKIWYLIAQFEVQGMFIFSLFVFHWHIPWYLSYFVQPGYHLKQVGSNSFSCQKLGQVSVRIYSKDDTEELIPSVLLSLSGDDGYRNNSVSGVGGQFLFDNLFPGNFYLRPLLKVFYNMGSLNDITSTLPILWTLDIFILLSSVWWSSGIHRVDSLLLKSCIEIGWIHGTMSYFALFLGFIILSTIWQHKTICHKSNLRMWNSVFMFLVDAKAVVYYIRFCRSMLSHHLRRQ